MTTTLLAVDDSATMRKVMEITFGGEDFNVVVAADRAGALAALGANPRALLVDAAHPEDGYALAKELRKALPNAAIVMLSSRYAPYDQVKGRDAGADDFIDTPFDTQQLIDKVKKLVAGRDAAAPTLSAPVPPEVEARPLPPPAPPAYLPPVAPPIAAAPAKPPVPVTRSGTLSFPSGSPAPAPPATPTPRPAPAVATRAGDGKLTGRLAELGLTDEQVAAVLALSREVVLQVVWEVVPVLAETLIKEEISRLTKDA